ncbi:hypothetical protein HYD67_00915 [Mycoplasmopsis bovis]|nr:hypothetical protein [Mycoplasmopsis bovis]QQH54806.1 hypothetical protein HYD67_00915 [Mycoplasmopsis bovis]
MAFSLSITLLLIEFKKHALKKIKQARNRARELYGHSWKLCLGITISTGLLSAITIASFIGALISII